MMRTVALVLGTMTLIDGIATIINPRYGFKIWEGGLRQYLPEPINDVTREYSKLSDGALRYVSVWEMVIASVLLCMAARVRE